MCFGARLFRIRGNDARPAIMCFDVGVFGDSRPSLLKQSTETSEPWEAEGPYCGTLIASFLGALL